MDLVEQVHIFGLSNIHTFEHNINLIRLFSLIFQLCKTPIITLFVSDPYKGNYCTFGEIVPQHTCHHD